MTEEQKKELDKYSAISAVLNTEGGELLKGYLEETFVSLLLTLLSKYKTEENLIPIIAKIDSTLDLLEKLTNAPKNKQMILDALE